MSTSTSKFDDVISKSISKDKEFGEAILKKAIQQFFEGNIKTSKAMIRYYVQGTIGIKNLSDLLGKNEKSLSRMLGPKGNPTLNNFCALFHAIQEKQGIKIDANIHSLEKAPTEKPKSKKRKRA